MPALPFSAPPAHTPSVLVADADPGLQASLAVLLEGRARVQGSSSLAQATAQVGASGCSKIVLIADTLLKRPSCVRDADSLSATLRQHDKCCLTVVLADSTTHCDCLGGFSMCAVVAKPFTMDRLLRRLGDLLKLRGESELWQGRLSSPIGRGLAFLACNYGQAPSLNDIAHAVCLSPSRFAHLFRAELGRSPKEYLARLRVEVAKRMLLESSEKLDSVADRLGFCDAPHFSRVFRKYVGVWPGDFRRAGRGADSGLGHQAGVAVAGDSFGDWSRIRPCCSMNEKDRARPHASAQPN
jgi:AraC-like DNA-binding protein